MGIPMQKERSFFEEEVGASFIQACVKTIETYLSIAPFKVQHTMAYDLQVNYEVGAYLRVTVDKKDVQLTIAFEKDFSISVYNKMLDEKKTQVNEDVLDCLSELTNIIYGLAKAPLVNKGHLFSAGRPVSTTELNSILKGRGSLEVKFCVDKKEPQFSLIFSL